MINVDFLSGLQHICCSTDKVKKLMLFGHPRHLEHLQMNAPSCNQGVRGGLEN